MPLDPKKVEALQQKADQLGKHIKHNLLPEGVYVTLVLLDARNAASSSEAYLACYLNGPKELVVPSLRGLVDSLSGIQEGDKGLIAFSINPRENDKPAS